MIRQQGGFSTPTKMARNYRKRTRSGNRKYGRKKTSYGYQRKARAAATGGSRMISQWNAYPLPRSPTPHRMLAKLRYDEYIELDGGLVAVADKRIFRTNSVFDPDFSTTGFQPYGFDQWSAFYDRYTVIGCKIRVTFVNNQLGLDDTSAPRFPYVCCIAHLDESVGLADIREYTMSTQNVNGVLTGADDKVELLMNVNPNKFMGVSGPVGNPSVTAPTNTNPTKMSYLHVAAGVVSGTVDGPQIRAYVQLEYSVVFTNPKQLGKS